MSFKHHAVLAVTCLTVSAQVTPAAAEPTGDALLARQLFDEGRTLVRAGQYQKACPKFEESLRQDPGIGAMYNLADCWEKIGRTSSAWSLFLDAAAAARRASQHDREQIARDRATKLEPRLSRLVIDVSNPAPGLTVQRSATKVERAAWGSAVPTDPGSYDITATAPGRKPWRSSITVPVGAGKTVATVPELVADSSVQGGLDAVGAADETHVQGSPPSGATQRTAGFVMAGVGVVGVGAGVFLGLRAKSKSSDLANLCPTGVCPQSEIDAYGATRDDATQARTLSFVAFAVGGAAVVGGTVLVLTAPRVSQSGSVGFWVDGSSAGVRMAGRW